MGTSEKSLAVRASFDSITPLDYTLDSSWLRRRHLGGALGDPAVFYVHPTTERTLERWFADPLDLQTQAGAEAVVELHSHAFPGNLWAPSYRQATTRAFHQHDEVGSEAYDLAFSDVWRAFLIFLHEVPDGPIVIAGHSQGSRHTIDILARILEGDPATSAQLTRRIVAAYAIGTGIRAGRGFVQGSFPLPLAQDQTGVLIGWNAALRAESELSELDNRPVDALSVNPITCLDWSANSGQSSHLGGSVSPFNEIRVDVHQYRGVVLVDELTDSNLGDFALPGGSLHAVEVQLFSRDISADVRRRTRAWRERESLKDDNEHSRE